MDYGWRIDIDDGPLLDEIEFKYLCDNLIEAFTVPGFDDVDPSFSGCHTAILGPAPAGRLGYPVWSEGRYDMLSLREAQMLADIIRQRLDLRLPESWAEVATSRFLVQSRDV